MDKIRVLLIGGNKEVRQVFSDVITSTAIALPIETSPSAALSLGSQPDVALVNINNPDSLQVETITEIKKKYQVAFIILVCLGKAIPNGILEKCMEAGVLDIIRLKENTLPDKERTKIHLQTLFAQVKVKQYAKLITNNNLAASLSEIAKPPSISDIPPKRKTHFSKPDIVLIAASTGGPAALEKVCSQLPSPNGVPIFIVQHMPKDFTRILAQSLSSKSKLRVMEAQDNELITNNKILVAPGGVHSTVYNLAGKPAVKFALTPPVNGVRPSADVLFASIAESYERKKVLVIVLTGMGNDGLKGVQVLKEKSDCYCLIQSAETCVVYGMPRSVYEKGLADEVVAIEQMGERVTEIIRNYGKIL